MVAQIKSFFPAVWVQNSFQNQPYNVIMILLPLHYVTLLANNHNKKWYGPILLKVFKTDQMLRSCFLTFLYKGYKFQIPIFMETRMPAGGKKLWSYQKGFICLFFFVCLFNLNDLEQTVCQYYPGYLTALLPLWVKHQCK